MLTAVPCTVADCTRSAVRYGTASHCQSSHCSAAALLGTLLMTILALLEAAAGYLLPCCCPSCCQSAHHIHVPLTMHTLHTVPLWWLQTVVDHDPWHSWQHSMRKGEPTHLAEALRLAIVVLLIAVDVKVWCALAQVHNKICSSSSSR